MFLYHKFLVLYTAKRKNRYPEYVFVEITGICRVFSDVLSGVSEMLDVRCFVGKNRVYGTISPVNLAFKSKYVRFQPYSKP